MILPRLVRQRRKRSRRCLLSKPSHISKVLFFRRVSSFLAHEAIQGYKRREHRPNHSQLLAKKRAAGVAIHVRDMAIHAASVDLATTTTPDLISADLISFTTANSISDDAFSSIASSSAAVTACTTTTPVIPVVAAFPVATLDDQQPLVIFTWHVYFLGQSMHAGSRFRS